MNQEEQQLYKEFEKQVWLFMDNDLPENKMQFWNEKLREIPELNNCITEYKRISNLYAEVKDVDLDLNKFNSMIDKAIKKDSFFTVINNSISGLFKDGSEFVFGKIAFASLLIIAAVIISLLSNRSNPVNNLSQKLNKSVLNWDAGFVDDQINSVGNLLKIAKDDDYRKYYKYKLTPTNMDKNINLINSNIENIKAEIEKENL
ncbi:MAG: hypothetical protein KDC88_05285 [Ignavibacteriae bacterium]|nr:hypothetical protein [Ignavibacteriota bacterium]MCB9208445.1 hypothetical protein [Ignavibacteriales bacterium]MCB9258447.1 hypothetical protein [Ignavibacteriales bacterium]